MKTKKMDVPEHWSEKISRNNDKVTIEADLDIAIDEVATHQWLKWKNWI